MKLVCVGLIVFAMGASELRAQFMQGFVEPTDSLWNAVAAREGRQEALRDSLLPHPTFWLPVGEAIGLNLLVGTFNYLMGSEYAKISFQTIADNFENGFDWDADQFITNQVAHPYNGSLYHNFARSLGYDYWGGSATPPSAASSGNSSWKTSPRPSTISSRPRSGVPLSVNSSTGCQA